MTSGSERRPRRRLLWLLALPLLLELLYVLAGNLFLRADVGPRWLNRRPERFEIRWQSGRTWIPGRVRLYGLHLEARSGKIPWHLSLESAEILLDLPALTRRQLHLTKVSGEGLAFRMPLPPALARFLNQPPPADLPSAPAPPKVDRPPWRIVLGQVTVRDVREVEVTPYRYLPTGVGGYLEGAADIEMRGPISVRNARLSLPPGSVHVLETEESKPGAALQESVARCEEVMVEADFGPVRREDLQGREGLRHLAGRLRLVAPETSLAALGLFVRNIPSMDLEGEGRLEVDLGLDHGRLTPGSRLEAVGQAAVRYLDYELEGEGRITGLVTDNATAVNSPGTSHNSPGTSVADNSPGTSVADNSPGTSAGTSVVGNSPGTLEVAFDRFALRQQGEADSHVFGRGASLRLTSSTVDLTAAEPRAEATVTLPDSEVPQLRYYNRFLPAEAGVRILGGSGHLSGRMRLTAPQGRLAGAVRLSGRRVTARIQDFDLEGDLLIDGVLPDGDVRERWVDLSGTRVSVENARLVARTAPQATHPSSSWWLRLELPQGRAHLRQPLELETAFRARLRDTSPLVAVVTRGREGPSWLRELLTVEGIHGSGRLAFRDRQIRARKLAFVVGDHTEIQGHLLFARPHLDALLFYRYRRLTAAVLVEDGKSDWDLVGSRKWYQRQEALWLKRGG